VSRVRALVSWSLLFCFPLAISASDKAETAKAIMYTHGQVQLNGSSSPTTMALFVGDAVHTGSDSAANITAEGSSVLVMPNSVLKFQGKTLDLEHGDVVVSTFQGLALKADEVTVAPSKDKAKFEVAENQDTVVIAARKGDLTVTDGEGTSTLREGQQTTKNRRKRAGAAPAASGAPISNKTAAILAGVAGAGAIGAVLATTGKKCMSPGTSNCKCTQNQQGNNNCQ
jgi:co-chaperonin GroES (HSP10)